ncbi:hypothetical protein EJD97_010308 [Solanum chilense]|uniref:Cytochrome P450 n=1 Tax=Solanum chilense TaxID=4083 RepID=A0A6N2BHF9_SOLCI|nr:hypothetical protein EJD97_010308 [Solanum chilense]
MSLKIGQKTIVVISSSTMAKQVLQKQDLAFSNRFITNALQAHMYSKFSVACLPVCPQWRMLRKILNKSVFSSNKLDANEHLRSQKVKELIAYCAKCSQQGKALDICQAVFKTNFNLMCSTLFSKDLADPFSDSKVELKDMIWGVMNEAAKINLADYFPILEKIDLQRIRYRANYHFGKLFKFLDDLIDERLEEKQRSHGEKNDVLEVLLNFSAENPKEMDQNHIKSMLLDLLAGGTDSPITILEWAMSELVRQPEIMKKVQLELGEVIGKGKQVEESNIPKLPYLQFIVKETLRMHPPTPFLIPRKVVEQDVELCNYIIPKDSLILVNVWAIGRDPTFWKDPLVFRPERFQNLEVDVRGQDFELIPFGAGRRICPSLPLAMRLVQTMLGSLLNSFNWKLEGDIEPKDLDMEETFSFISSKAHPLRVIPSPL